ncbi:MAG: pirin family protein [Bacteroidales bacterium]|nr:pirin family protein [Bacteroidales bacterium]
MKTFLHKADSRGYFNHGWLQTHHSFSFADYYNPERIRFGVLRVLNDDIISGGKGFGTHPHDNMEIITIPLSGALAHKDSMGNSSIIRQGEIQVMSAGTGIQHSEFNANQDQDCSLLQIWLFPDKRNVKPRYQQISISDLDTSNKFGLVVSPNPENQGVWIHQDAWFYLGDFAGSQKQSYKINKVDNGIYLFVIEGKARITEIELEKRDGIGVYLTDSVEIEIIDAAKILLMEVPMH